MRTALRSLPVLAAAALILAACSSLTSSSSSSGAPAATAPASSSSPAPGASVSGSPASAASAAPAGSPAASTGNAPTSVEGLAGYTGADRQQILEAGAQKEGNLTWYTSLAGPVVDALVAGYKSKYPYVQVNVYRGADQDIITKATQEAQASQESFDVLESPPDAVEILGSAGILTPYYSPPLDQMPDSVKADASGNEVLGTTVRQSYLGFGYNTSLLPASDVPHTLQDLLNPDLQGKLALSGSSGWRWLGGVLHELGDSQGQQFLSQLASQQKPAVQQVSAQALLGLIAQGEVVASPTIYRDHVLQAQNQQQAPVQWVPLNPVVSNTGEAALATRAAHPNAALLYIDYLLSDGQDVLKQYYYAPGVDQESFEVFVPEAGKNADQIQSDATSWLNLFQQDFRQ